jgi:type IV pilus assembly protein PilC
MDRLLLKVPVFGDLIFKSVIARWTRTLSTMFAAGVPWWRHWTRSGGRLRQLGLRAGNRDDPERSVDGTSLTAAMTNATSFPSMVLQMCAIGEESGSLDHMLAKAATSTRPSGRHGGGCPA